jgi:carbamoyltransferase
VKVALSGPGGNEVFAGYSSFRTVPRFESVARKWEHLPDLGPGIPVILDTSFSENEPIVCTPEEAIDCFQRTRMDVVAIGSFVVTKRPDSG